MAVESIRSQIHITRQLAQQCSSCRHIYTGSYKKKSVIVKQIRTNRAATEEEIQALRKLYNPYVIKLLHHEILDDDSLFALEYFSHNLEDYCTGNYRGPMPVREMALIHMADGLYYIHSKDIVHGNLNPRAIKIVSVKSEVYLKIGNFVLGNADEEECSLRYLAAETLKLIFSGEKIENVSQLRKQNGDVFALGCVFYYFLTEGIHPFGDSFMALNNIISSRYDLGELIGDQVQPLIELMINADPKSRPEMSAVLEKLFELYVRYGRHLGRGGFGTVCEAHFCNLKVAIKEIQIEDDTNYEREAKAMMQLEHVNVVKLIYSAKRTGQRNGWFFVLELCAGTLEDHISFIQGKWNKRRIEMPDEIDVLVDMATGLEYIHSNKHVHRDIKPQNILISLPCVKNRVVLKIADFGLSKLTTESGQFSVSKIAGTDCYMAPEYLQWDAEDKERKANIKIDIFSLGCVFYRFLAKGIHPFGDQPNIIHANIIEHEYNLSQLSGHKFLGLVEEMISKDPTNRPTSRCVRERLEQHLPVDNVTPTIPRMSTSSVDTDVISVSTEDIAEFSEDTETSRAGKPLQYMKTEVSGTCRLTKQPCFIDKNHRGSVFSCSFHPNGVSLACAKAAGIVCIFTGKNRDTPFDAWELTEEKEAQIKSDIHKLRWSESGEFLAAGCANGSVIVWTFTTTLTEMFKVKKHKNAIRCLVWSTYNQTNRFATGSYNGRVCVWDTNKKLVNSFKFHQDQIRGLAWINDEKLATCSMDGNINICDVSSGTCLQKFGNLANKSVQSICWNPRSRTITACSLDGRLQLWTENGGCIAVPGVDPSIPLYCMDLYRKLKGQKFTWIACGTGNHSVRLWKAEGQAPDDLYLVDKPSKMIVIDVSFSPNGQYLAAIDRNCFIVIWSFVSNTPSKVFSERLSQKDALYKSLNWNSSGTKLAIANLAQEIIVIEFQQP